MAIRWSAELATVLRIERGEEDAPAEAPLPRCGTAFLVGGASLVASVLVVVAVFFAGAASRTPAVKDIDHLQTRKLFEDKLEAVAFMKSPVGGSIPIFKASWGLSDSGYMIKGVPGMWARNLAYTELFLADHDCDVRHRQALQALAAKDPHDIVVLLNGDLYSGGCPEGVLRHRYALTARAAGARVVLGADATQRAAELDVSTRLTNASRVDVKKAVMQAFRLDEDAMTKYVALDTTLGSNGPADYMYPNVNFMMGPVADVLEFLNCVLGAGAASGTGYSRELGANVCFLMGKSKATLDYTGGLLLSSAHISLDELMVIKQDTLDHAILKGPLCFIESGAHHDNPWAGGLMDVARRFKAWPGSDHPSFGPIPLTVFVTAPVPFVGELADMWRENMAHLPPSTKLAFFDDAQMTESARQISAELAAAGVTDGAFEAYSGLRPMAYRADLWRCMVLWQHGGIYLDHKVRLLDDMWNYIDFGASGTLWILQDRVLGAFWNAFMVGPPRHPAFELVIKRIVENVRFKVYEKDPLNLNGQFVWDFGPLTVSGPVAWAWALGTYGIRGEMGRWTIDGFHNLPQGRAPRIFARFEMEEDAAIYNYGANPHKICINVPSLHHQTEASTASTYGSMFHAFQAYCDGSGPPCPPV